MKKGYNRYIGAKNGIIMNERKTNVRNAKTGSVMMDQKQSFSLMQHLMKNWPTCVKKFSSHKDLR